MMIIVVSRDETNEKNVGNISICRRCLALTRTDIWDYIDRATARAILSPHLVRAER
jgi:hypothetical protein